MANNLSASFEEIWAAQQQRVFYRTNVGMAIADLTFNAAMRSGDTLNRTYRSAAAIDPYTRGTAINIQDITDTNEQLSVNREFAAGIYVDDFDAIQSKYEIAAMYGKDYGVKLSNKVDADILGEVVNATSTIDDGDFGGTAGNGLSITTSNVLQVFGAAKRKLAKQQVDSTDFVAAISPELEEVVVQYTAGRDTALGDTTQANGYLGSFLGFKLYRSNNTAGSAVLSLATNPSNTDTVTINGVVFTFVSSIGTTAGNVLIGASADATRANLAALINAPGTTTANGVALSAANQRIMNGVTATNNDSANTLTVVAKGVGAITVSEALTDATDTWTPGKIIQHNLFGVRYAPVCVVQSAPSVQVKDVQDKFGKNVLNGVLYGVKTFQDNAKMMVNVKLAAASFSAPTA